MKHLKSYATENSGVRYIFGILTFVFLLTGTGAFFKYMTQETEPHKKTPISSVEKAKLKVAAGTELETPPTKDNGETIHVTPPVLKKEKAINHERHRAIVKTMEVNITCPVYVIPRFVPLPELPRERLSKAKTEKEIIDILYENIRAHQLYTQEQRKVLFDSYDKYLDTCSK